MEITFVEGCRCAEWGDWVRRIEGGAARAERRAEREGVDGEGGRGGKGVGVCLGWMKGRWGYGEVGWMGHRS